MASGAMPLWRKGNNVFNSFTWSTGNIRPEFNEGRVLCYSSMEPKQ